MKPKTPRDEPSTEEIDVAELHELLARAEAERQAQRLIREGLEGMQREWDKGPSWEPAIYGVPPSYVKAVQALEHSKP